jgi:Domain of unknown function (DUF4160)
MRPLPVRNLPVTQAFGLVYCAGAYRSAASWSPCRYLSSLRVVIYPNDHRPAHVHGIGSSCEAIFELNCPDGPVRLRENFGFARHELNSIEKALGEHVPQLCRAWEGIHGYA